MKIVAISDTHGMHKGLAIPNGDVFIHAGDFTSHGTIENLLDFCSWIEKLPHKHKIIIAGNHDMIAQKMPLIVRESVMRSGGKYLIDEPVTVDSVKFYGSPWTPTFMDWHFMANRGAEISKKWEMIPNDTDVLITHGPPASCLDVVKGKGSQGCADLLKRVRCISPSFHVFGHIHECGGATVQHTHDLQGIRFINASVLDGNYRRAHKAMVFEV